MLPEWFLSKNIVFSRLFKSLSNSLIVTVLFSFVLELSPSSPKLKSCVLCKVNEVSEVIKLDEEQELEYGILNPVLITSTLLVVPWGTVTLNVLQDSQEESEEFTKNISPSGIGTGHPIFIFQAVLETGPYAFICKLLGVGVDLAKETADHYL